MKKDVIYIDIEDDITAIIAKLKAAKSKVVALVPPKRASVLNSVVNLRLLKKAANDNKKQLVLVTADPALKSLAGGLEMYVAKNLTTPPEIPENSNKPQMPSDTINSSSSAVGAAAVASATGAKLKNETEEEAEPEDKKPEKKPIAPISKSKLPNFTRFRKRIFIGVGVLVLLVLAWWQAFIVMPEASISLRGQTTNVRAEFDATLDSSASEVDLEENVLPAQLVTVESTESAEVTATGEENRGKKATGSITIENCYSSESVTFVSGTRVESPSGKVFVFNSQISVPGGTFAGVCTSPGTATVDVTASQIGDDYNVAAAEYEFVNSVEGEYTLTGSAMSGGTTEIVNILTQDDVQRALNTLEGEASTLELLDQLRSEAGDGVYIFDDTLASDINEPRLDNPVGSEIEVTQVTVETTTTAYGVTNDQLNELLTERYQQQIAEQQAITDTGIDGLVIDLVSQDESTAEVSIVANGSAGPDVNTEELAEQLVGLKFSEAKSITDSLPGVIESTIDLSPMWVGNMPRSAEKITIEIQDPDGVTEDPVETEPES